MASPMRIGSSPGGTAEWEQLMSPDRCTATAESTKSVNSDLLAAEAVGDGDIAERLETSTREAILKTVSGDGLALEHVPEIFRSDHDIVLAAVKQNGDALTFAAPAVAQDMEVVCAAVTSKWTNGQADRYREVVWKTVAASEHALGRASKHMREDRQVVMRAVSAHGESLQYASDDLKADREVVLAAIRQNTEALRHVPAFRTDKEIALEAVRTKGSCLKRFAECVRDDRQIVLAAMENAGDAALQCATKAIRDEVKAAVRATGQPAIEALRSSIEQGPGTPEREFRATVLRTRTDRDEVLREVAKANGGALTHPLAHSVDSIRDDEEVVLAAVAKHGESLQHASERLRGKRNVALAACSNNGDALRYCSDDLRQDRSLVLRACRTSGNALKHAASALRNEREVVFAAVRQNGDALAHASEERRNDRQVVLAAVEKNRASIKFASAELQKDNEIVSRTKATERSWANPTPSVSVKGRGPRAPTLGDFATFKPGARPAREPADELSSIGMLFNRDALRSLTTFK